MYFATHFKDADLRNILTNFVPITLLIFTAEYKKALKKIGAFARNELRESAYLASSV